MNQLFVENGNIEANCPHCQAVIDVSEYQDTKKGYSVWNCKSCRNKIAVWLVMTGEIRISKIRGYKCK